MQDWETFDVVIIGSGPSGLSCAITMKNIGLSCVIIEKGVLVNSIYNFPSNMTFFSTSQLLEIGEVPFISHNEKPTRAEALEYYRRVVDSWNLDLRTFEKVEQLIPLKKGYETITSKGKFRSQFVVVATGFYDQPNLLNVQGEELDKVHHYYKDAHPYIGKDVLVVGAANSACDVALELYHKGAFVNMVVRDDWIYDKVKYWIKPNIENRIKEGSIGAYFMSEVTVIKEKSVVLSTPDGIVEIENDFVLAMTGYHPDFSFLRKLGVAITDDDVRLPMHNSETFESNLPGVYLAGVICAGMNTSKLFIENTRFHGENIAAHMLDKMD